MILHIVVMPQVSICQGRSPLRKRSELSLLCRESLLAQSKYVFLHWLTQSIMNSALSWFPVMYAVAFQLCFLLADKPWIWNIPYTQAPDTNGNVWVPSWGVQASGIICKRQNYYGNQTTSVSLCSVSVQFALV